jgi:CRP-like cAMP-binding protein
MATVTAERLRAAPLLASFDDAGLAAIAELAREAELPAGHELVRQGGPADGAWLLEAGALAVVRKLPGGGELPLAALGPGALVGEISLLRDEPRTATVRATAPSRAIFLDRRLFRASRERLEPAALQLTRAILVALARRVRSLEAEAAMALAGAVPGDAVGPARAVAPAEPGFDWRAFLPLLPCFRGFEPADLAALAPALEPFGRAAGETLLAQGEGPADLLIVARGAVEGVWRAGDGAHQVAVLGPGEFCCAGLLLEAAPAPLTWAAREDALLLRLDGAAFRSLYGARSRAGLALLDALAAHLARAQRRAGGALARTLGLARAGRLLVQTRKD